MIRQSRTLLFALLAGVITLTVISCSRPSTDPWNNSELIKPEELAQKLTQPTGARPHLLQIGFQFLYNQKHIPGSIYAGPGAEEAGIQRLDSAVSGLPKDAEIVIYCGCCPWDHCPNIRPAFAELKRLGYTNFKLLETPTNLKTDWIDKNYPTEAGSGALG